MQIFYAYYCNCSFVCLFLTTYKCKRLHLNSVKTGDDIQVVPKKMRWSSVRNLMCVGRYGFSGKILGDWNKNIKKQPFSDASASHLSLVLCYVWFQANHINHKPKGRFFWYAFGIYKPKEPSLWFVNWGWGLNQPHHTTYAALPSEGGGIAKRIKTARLRRKTKPGRDVILHVRP